MAERMRHFGSKSRPEMVLPTRSSEEPTFRSKETSTATAGQTYRAIGAWISGLGCFGTMGKDVQYSQRSGQWLRIARAGPFAMPQYRMVINFRKNLVPSVSTVACLGDFLWELIRYLFADLS